MTIGKAKFIFERWKNYSSALQFLMVTFMFVTGSGVNWWLMLGGLVLSVVFVIVIDLPFIAPSEYEYSSTINPQWNKLMENTKK